MQTKFYLSTIKNTWNSMIDKQVYILNGYSRGRVLADLNDAISKVKITTMEVLSHFNRTFFSLCLVLWEIPRWILKIQ